MPVVHIEDRQATVESEEGEVRLVEVGSAGEDRASVGVNQPACNFCIMGHQHSDVNHRYTAPPLAKNKPWIVFSVSKMDGGVDQYSHLQGQQVEDENIQIQRQICIYLNTNTNTREN